MPSQQFHSLIAMVRARPASPDATLQDRRDRFELVSDLFPLADDVMVQATHADGVPVEWIDTPESRPAEVLLFLHGGGYAVGSLNTHRHLVADLARAGHVRGLSTGYRLAPEHPFPAAIEDAAAVYRWLVNEGIDPARIVIAGDSAGGGLTLATMLTLRDAGDPLPAAAVLLSPWTDLAATSESITAKAAVDPMLTPDDLHKYAAWYLGGRDRKDTLASPLYANLAGLPPLLIHVGTAEILLDDSVLLAERARAAGVDVSLVVEDDMIHVWHYFAQVIPEGEQSVRDVGAFIRRHVS
ncbi:MAG: alpha/beta hydrolase [Candidatus Hydrogenedentota bacterium]